MLPLPAFKLSTRGQVILAIGIAALWLFARQQISQMDGWFFQPSIKGAKGLTLYLIGDYTGAAKAYRAHFREEYATRTAPGDPVSQALLRGDLEGAKAITQMALEKDPNDANALFNLGRIALEENAPEEAQTHLNRILEKDPDHADALVLSSIALARSDKYGKAIDPLNRTLRNSRIGSGILAFLMILETTGKLDDLPKPEKPLCLLAHYYRYLRIFDPSNGRLAIAYAKKAIAAGDRPADAYLTIGVVYDKQGKREKALHAFRKATDVNPKYAMGFWWAAIVYAKRGDIANEYRTTMAAFEAEPSDPFYIWKLDHVLMTKLGDAHQAVQLLEKAVAANPENWIAMDRLGYAYNFLGEHQRSVDTYRQALQVLSRKEGIYQGEGYSLDKVIKTYEGLAYSLGEMGKTDEAVAVLRKAISLAPDDPAPHAQIGYLYHRKDRYREAIAAYEEAFRLGEHNTETRSSLCALYHITSQFEHAADCFKRVLAENPRDQRALRLLPETLDNLNLQQSTQ